MNFMSAHALYQGGNCIVQMERQREDGVYAFLLNQCLDGVVAAEPRHNLLPLHLTVCIGMRPVVLSIANTASTDSVVTLMVFHQQSKAGWEDAVSEAVRVLVDIALSLAVQVAEGSSRRDPALWVALQFKFLRLALTSCWSGGRLSMFSFIEKMFNSDSSTDDCSEDSYGVGQYPGDLPGYDRNIIQFFIYSL